ncbi:hypothetical protein TNCT_400191 [Trichonephila clavata]|uniref:Uncharacterized protein n=1 Tax=Trichonephila clavata TaxID=2740835 RepID=A0A8X6LX33_TRICU|nr:hypothetical protein TNCT_400191 [Trichonephila clavata]
MGTPKLKDGPRRAVNDERGTSIRTKNKEDNQEGGRQQTRVKSCPEGLVPVHLEEQRPMWKVKPGPSVGARSNAERQALSGRSSPGPPRGVANRKVPPGRSSLYQLRSITLHC